MCLYIKIINLHVQGHSARQQSAVLYHIASPEFLFIFYFHLFVYIYAFVLELSQKNYVKNTKFIIDQVVKKKIGKQKLDLEMILVLNVGPANRFFNN